ncbi:MAG: heme exporter protein CcmD [Alphaproteobacteria bacterium]|nr:heme exporter protein CcmD [Alphaproteobacteria bacterium]MBF0129242.1 heme exporter protein CcmD [Alphaproteobacteria bacterium]
MGGYAGFVWPSYGVTAVALLALAVGSVRAMRAREAELRDLQASFGDRRTAALKADAAHDP